jgi:hypothetical protein
MLIVQAKFPWFEAIVAVQTQQRAVGLVVELHACVFRATQPSLVSGHKQRSPI